LPAKTDAKDNSKPKPQPVQIKVGITDGVSTEVLDGLEEGTQVVIGSLSGDASRQSGASNPFGGGPFRRF
jgi:HlyD family secretion protein